jgi:hypothetical protein
MINIAGAVRKIMCQGCSERSVAKEVSSHISAVWNQKTLSKYHYSDYGHYFPFSQQINQEKEMGIKSSSSSSQSSVFASPFFRTPSILISQRQCSDVLNIASLDGIVERLSAEGVGSRVVAADNRARRRVGAVVLVRARSLSNLIKLSVQSTSWIINLHTAIAVLSPAY